MTLLAYHNDPAIKQKYVARVKTHALADKIVKGQYWEHGKGCAVGCTIEGSDHKRYEVELGIPEQLARIEDRLFENLPLFEAKLFPLQFLEIIPVGADLSLVCSRLMFDILVNSEHGVLNIAKSERSKTAIQTVINLYERRLQNDEPSPQEWRAADAAAYAAYADAAYAADAADAAAAYAAYAAYAADAADAAAAYAAYAAYADAARINNRLWQRDRLLYHLSNAPVLSEI